MKVIEARTLVEKVANAKLKVPVMMVGAMGIGKSWIVKQAAKNLGIECIDLRLAQQEPGDLIGIPRYDSAKGSTVWAKPEWWPKEGTSGILFLDELNRAPTDVRQAIFQLVNEWRMHTHVLPEGWSIVSAINPDNSQYQVETLDPAMIRRFCMIKLSADVEVWQKWAHGEGQIDESITGFIAAHSDMLAKSDSFKIETQPNPDAYRMLDALVKAKVIDKEIEIEVYTGLIGHEAAVAYRSWCDSNYSRPVSGKDILTKYTDEKAKIREKFLKQKNADNFVTTKELLAELDAHKKPNKDQVANLVAFLKDANSETKATVVSKLPKDYLAEVMTHRDLTQTVAEILRKSRDPK